MCVCIILIHRLSKTVINLLAVGRARIWPKMFIPSILWHQYVMISMFQKWGNLLQYFRESCGDKVLIEEAEDKTREEMISHRIQRLTVLGRTWRSQDSCVHAQNNSLLFRTLRPTTAFVIELCAVVKLKKFFRIKVLGAPKSPHFLTPSKLSAIVQVHPSLSCLLFSFYSRNSIDILLCELIAQTLQADQWDILEWVLLVAFKASPVTSAYGCTVVSFLPQCVHTAGELQRWALGIHSSVELCRHRWIMAKSTNRHLPSLLVHGHGP